MRTKLPSGIWRDYPVLLDIKAQGLSMNIPMIETVSLDFLEPILTQYSKPRILEIGTAIGYSAIALALMTHGHVTTIERERHLYEIAVENLIDAKLKRSVKLIHGDAFDVDFSSYGQFEIIFIDGAKAQYQRLFEKLSPLLSKEGLIITDNLSFHGYVHRDPESMTRNQRAIARKITNYVEWLKNCSDFETNFYDIGDGLSISKRK